MKISLVVLSLFLLSPALRLYDRCDDVCRVLGYKEGGRCEEVDDTVRCLCKPDNFDAGSVLSNACDKS